MTLFLSIGQVADVIDGTDLALLRTFRKHIERVTAVDMAALAKQCELSLGRQRGRTLMKRLLAEISTARTLGVIAPCPAARFTLTSHRLTLGEFRRMLLKFHFEERRLIVVALASGKSLVECSLFQHKEIKKIANINKWSTELRRFIEMTPRHIQCPYVFWMNDSNNQPVALLGLDAKFREVAKASWSTFALLCADLIPLDSQEDAKEFATMFLLESANPVKA